jgi:hypothetical protein
MRAERANGTSVCVRECVFSLRALRLYNGGSNDYGNAAATGWLSGLSEFPAINHENFFCIFSAAACAKWGRRRIAEVTRPSLLLYVCVHVYIWKWLPHSQIVSRNCSWPFVWHGSKSRSGWIILLFGSAEKFVVKVSRPDNALCGAVFKWQLRKWFVVLATMTFQTAWKDAAIPKFKQSLCILFWIRL